MKKPFFSIIIPTFNRIHELKRAINCILNQDFQDYEIIVVDNHSQDNTASLITRFNNKKIIFFRNGKNIGWNSNFKKGMKIAKGKYVIFHGDDDFLIYPDTLKEVCNLFIQHNYGYIRLNFVKLTYNKKRLFDYYKKIFEDLKIRPQQTNENIVDFLIKSELNFFTGVIYKNYKNAYKDVFKSELGPYFPILFKNVYKYGGYLISKYHFISSWSRPSGTFYLLENGKFKFERYYEEIAQTVDKEYYINFLNEEMRIMTMLMPAVKLTMGLQNLFPYAKRIIHLIPEYKFSPSFWMYFFLAISIPKFILQMIREYNESGNKSYKIPHQKQLEHHVFSNPVFALDKDN